MYAEWSYANISFGAKKANGLGYKLIHDGGAVCEDSSFKFILKLMFFLIFAQPIQNSEK